MDHYHFWLLQTDPTGRLCYVQDPWPYRNRATCNRHGRATGREFMVLACRRLCWSVPTITGLK